MIRGMEGGGGGGGWGGGRGGGGGGGGGDKELSKALKTVYIPFTLPSLELIKH